MQDSGVLYKKPVAIGAADLVLAIKTVPDNGMAKGWRTPVTADFIRICGNFDNLGRLAGL